MEFSFKSILIYTVIITHVFSYTPMTYAAIPQSSSQRILIQSIDADDSEFETFLSSMPGYTSLEKVRPQVPAKAESQLRSLQVLADTEFVGDDPQRSIPLYTQIVSMALDQDWNEESRKIIFTSFFRLAQLQPEQINKYLRKAAMFDFNQYPDPEVIPLTLQASFHNMKQTLESQMIEFHPSSTKTFYVNGVAGQKNIHPKGMYRLTFVSNVYGMKTEVLNGETAQDIFPFGTPIAQGRCQDIATVNPDIRDLNRSFVFSSKNCSPKLLATVAQLTQSKMQRTESKLRDTLPTKDVAVQNVSLNLYPSSINTDQISDSTPIADNTTKGRLSKKQKTWIMVLSGIAAVTLGAMLIDKQSDKSRNYAPVENSGF